LGKTEQGETIIVDDDCFTLFRFSQTPQGWASQIAS
jgi:hypothetical protein